jgi:hypothetical protein
VPAPLRRFPDEAKKCKDIQLVCMDATQYPLPEEPLVLYVADPFVRPVMIRFIETVNKSFQRYPRRIVVLYVVPKSLDLWDRVAFLKKVKATESLCVFDTMAEMIPAEAYQKCRADTSAADPQVPATLTDSSKAYEGNTGRN